jgi:anti-sigma factor RsiW
MECAIVRKKLSAYVDGELPAPQMDAVRAHLAACGNCAQECQELSFAWHFVEEIPRVAPRTSLWPSIEERISAKGASFWGFLWRPSAALTSLFLVVGLYAGVKLGTFVLTRSSPAASPAVVAGGTPNFDTVRYFGDVPPGTLGDGGLEVTPVSAAANTKEGVQQ